MGKRLTLEEIYEKSCEKFGEYPVGSRHEPLFGVACRAYECGYCDADSLEAELKRMWAQYGQGTVDDNDCHNTAVHVCRMMTENGKVVLASPKSKEEKKTDKANDTLRRAHEAKWREWAERAMASGATFTPYDDGFDGTETTEQALEKQAALMLKAMQTLVPLGDREWVYCGGRNWDTQSKAYLDREWHLCDSVGQKYWVPNVLLAPEHRTEQCKEIRYLLLEMDDAITTPKARKGTEAWYDELEAQQLRLWAYLRTRISVACLTYSGGKSLHALVPVQATVQELADAKERLKKAYSELHFDTANIDAVRKTRTPFGLRTFVVGSGGVLADDDLVRQRRLEARNSKSEAKRTEAKVWLAEHGIEDDSECICRYQRCYYVNENEPHISIGEFCEQLEAVVEEFLPKADGLIEKAIQDDAEPVLTSSNIARFLDYKGWSLWYDGIMLRVVLQHDGETETDLDGIVSIVRDEWAVTFSLKSLPSREQVESSLKHVYRHNVRNPIVEWLNGLEWDGTDRIQTIYDILNVRDGYEQELIRKWLLQTVALAENNERLQLAPQGVLTFMGCQGMGKTNFLTGLLPLDKHDWVGNGAGLNVENKDNLMQLIRGWILELGEVDSTLARDQTRLKAVITNKKQSIRLPYDRNATDVWTHVSLCASVNDKEFLRDPTGNRRWWVIEPRGRIDLRRLGTLDKEQLWAQLWKMWNDSDKTKYYETFGLSDVDTVVLEKHNEKFKVDSGYDSAIRECFDFSSADRSNRMTCTQIALKVINRCVTDDTHRQHTVSDRELKAIAKGLASLGLKKHKVHGISVYQMPPELTEQDLRTALDTGLYDERDDMSSDPLFGDADTQVLPEEEEAKTEEVLKDSRDNDTDVF